MSVSYDVTTTSSTAEVTIYDINRIPQSGNIIHLRTWLNNSFVEWVENIDVEWLIDYNYVYENLSANTTYSFEIEFWEDTTIVDSISGSFTTQSGGGGDQWSLSYRGKFYPSSSTTLETLSSGIAEKTVYLYWLYFYDNATITVYTSGNGDTIGYLSANNQDSFDYDNGIPYNSLTDNDDGGDNRNFSITYTVTANTGYYLWVKTYQGSAYSSSVSVNITMNGGSSTQWDYIHYNLGSISASDTTTYPIQEYYLNRIMFSPTQSGTLRVSSTGSTDIVAYLTMNTGFDPSTGEPTADTNPITLNGNTGSTTTNIDFTAEVTSGSVYYLWIRGYSANMTGSTTVTVSPPAAWSVYTMAGGNNLNATLMLETVPIYTKTLTRIEFSIKKAGSVRFYSTGQSDVQVYLSTSTSYNSSTGVPNNGTITLSGNTGTSTTNFDCTATLSAGTTYYLWVRCVSESSSGSICVVIVPPTGGSVSGNGQVYIYVWNYSTNRGSWLEATPGIYVNGSWI